MTREALEQLACWIEQKYPGLKVGRPPQMGSIWTDAYGLTIRRDGRITLNGRIGYEDYELLRDVMSWAELLRDGEAAGQRGLPL
jgi:hypothetical protein